MYDPNSPILDFYPLEFEQDLNGKKQDWEAIVKIPFIDEERLLKAMSCACYLFSTDSVSDIVATQCASIALRRKSRKEILVVQVQYSGTIQGSQPITRRRCQVSSHPCIDVLASWNHSIYQRSMVCI